MRVVIQRVRQASVQVGDECVGKIGRGLLVLVGIARHDSEKDIDWMVEKIINLRIFEKENGKLDESLIDIKGSLLVVSQFTLYGDCRKGRRPSFSDAMPPEDAKRIFETFVCKAKSKVSNVQTGIFQANMDVLLTNEGPVTLIIDSKK
ncbi:MAG: D-aminoacyl-tRNA deacylase [Syntrophorhabdaceae bacterium]